MEQAQQRAQYKLPDVANHSSGYLEYIPIETMYGFENGAGSAGQVIDSLSLSLSLSLFLSQQEVLGRRRTWRVTPCGCGGSTKRSR